MNKILALLLLSLSLIVSCVNNSDEPTIDCTASDLTIGISSSVSASCVTLGSVILLANGGSGDFTYSKNGTTFQSNATFEDLSAGSFTFLVQDSDGCIASKSFILEADGNAISLSLTASNSDCDVDNGGIEAAGTGGEGLLSYSLDGGTFQSSSNFNNVSPGTHNVIVKDEEGCEASKDIEVDANVSLTDDIFPIISSNCAISACHGGSQSPSLSTSSAIIANASRIKSRTTAETMPPASRPDLSANQISLIACWVDGGAKNN